ncbi:hypothetical protein MyChFU_25160 [Mycobacterium intracellulare subsp. chimaera]
MPIYAASNAIAAAEALDAALAPVFTDPHRQSLISPTPPTLRYLLRAAQHWRVSRNSAAREATRRQKVVNVPPAWPDRNADILHLPGHWPWADAWFTLWRNIIGQHRQTSAGRTERSKGKRSRPADTARHPPKIPIRPGGISSTPAPSVDSG